MEDLAGANAIVTGASRGLGVRIARALADRGVDLALAARSTDQLEAVRTDLVGRGVKVVAIETDVRDPRQRQQLVDRAEAELGALDILVNNAGIEANAVFHESDPDEATRIVDVNLTAAMLLTRLVLPGMLERGRGHVVNVSSLAGKSGTPHEAAYSASKFGLVGLTQALRSEYVDEPVGFSVVCPGFVAGEGMYARVEAEGVEPPRSVGKTTPDKVARAVIDAIRRDRPEVLVTPTPVRPLLVLATALPGSHAPLIKAMGINRMLRRAADTEARRHP